MQTPDEVVGFWRGRGLGDDGRYRLDALGRNVDDRVRLVRFDEFEAVKRQAEELEELVKRNKLRVRGRSEDLHVRVSSAPDLLQGVFGDGQVRSPVRPTGVRYACIKDEDGDQRAVVLG